MQPTRLFPHLLICVSTLYLGMLPGFSQQAHAFVVTDQVTNQRLEMNVNLPTDTIDTIGFGETSWNALAETALARWNDAGVGLLPDHAFFSIRATSVSGDPCAGDGLNTVNFRAQPCNGLAWGDTLGITTTRFSTGLSVVEVDVAFNGEMTWEAYTGPLRRQAEGPAPRVDGDTIIEFTRVALHEFGHALGLDHPDEFGQTVQALMNGLISDIDSIQPDDEDGARAVPFIPSGGREDRHDLSVTLTKVKHIPKGDGDKIIVKANVRHVGTTALNAPIEISLFRSTDDALDRTDRLIQTTEISTILSTPGQEISVTLKKDSLASLVGSFVLVAVDSNNRIDELDEGNNVVSYQILGRGCGKDTFIPEDEPNDVPATNQGGIGKIRPGQCVRIEGVANSVNADFDGYHFFPRGNQRLEFTLTHDPGMDFDLLFFDFADAGNALLSCNAATTPEVCSIRLAGNPDGTQRFDLVVVPIAGIGPYTLDIFSRE